MNEFRYFLISIALVICSCSAKQDANEQFAISLKQIVSDSFPFGSVAAIGLISEKANFNIQGLDSLRRGTFKLNSNVIDKTKSKALEIPFIIGKKSGESVIIFDNTADGDFSNDQQIQLKKNVKTSILLQNAPLLIADSILKLQVQIIADPAMTIMGFPKSDDMLVFTITPRYRYGIFQSGVGNYKIAAFNYFMPDFNSPPTHILIVPEENKFPSVFSYPVQYKVGDSIYLDKMVYQFKSIKADGSEIILEKIQELDREYGVEVDNYAFTLQGTDLNSGKKFTLGTGKNYTLLDFWGTWCMPCLEQTDDLIRVNKKYNKKKFKLVSIAYDKSIKKVQDYIEQHGLYWTNLYDDSNNSLIASKFKIQHYPTLILLDPDGKIIKRETGEQAVKKIEAYLDTIL